MICREHKVAESSRKNLQKDIIEWLESGFEFIEAQTDG